VEVDHFRRAPTLFCLQISLSRFPGFPVEVGGGGKLYAAFFKERRTRCHVQRGVAGNPGRLVTFYEGEMQATTAPKGR
jgi:hypothetical protein